MGWKVWKQLRENPAVELAFADMPPSFGPALVFRQGGHAAIILATGLDPGTRRCVLGHELVHLERGLPPGDAPAWLVAKEELAVDRETARRLLPDDELIQAVDQILAQHDHVSPALLAEHVEISLKYAERRLAEYVAKAVRRHPSTREPMSARCPPAQESDA